MSNNPLKQYFRRPAVYIKLPSGGKDYPSGVIDLPDTGELPVYPMTAIDEITTKTPDALFNGTAITEILKSCVPNILDPWRVNNTDMDAILLAIKAASGSQNLEIDSTCPKCSETSTYTTEIMSIISTLKSPDYSSTLDAGDLKIKFGPLTYKEMNEAALAQFKVERIFRTIDAIKDAGEKALKTKDMLIEMTEATMLIIAKTIKYIETPDSRVDDLNFILDFLKNCDKNVYISIRDHHSALKADTDLKPLDVKCSNCEHEYKQPFTINASDFFG